SCFRFGTTGRGRVGGSSPGRRATKSKGLRDLVDRGGPAFVDAPYLVDRERARPRDQEGSHDDVSRAADEIEARNRVEYSPPKSQQPDQNLGELDEPDEQSDEHRQRRDRQVEKHLPNRACKSP